jgi:hypothetical protein
VPAPGSNAYTLSAGGQTLATMQTRLDHVAGDDPVEHAECGRRSQALTVSVRDAAGKTGSGSVTVTVRNGVGVTAANSPPELATAGRRPDGVGDPAAHGVTVSGTPNVIVLVSWCRRRVQGLHAECRRPDRGHHADGLDRSRATPWNTRSVADGSRVLTASVRDAAGKTGSRQRDGDRAQWCGVTAHTQLA